MMKKKVCSIVVSRMQKVLLSLGVMACVLCCNTMVSEAATTYSDAETNNSPSESQFIIKNEMDATRKIANTSGPSYRYVKGTLSANDEDWYRVNLEANESNYLTINAGSRTIYVTILNSKQEVVSTLTYVGNSSGQNVFEIEIETDGLYYIGLSHPYTMNSEYKFTIGEPEYLLGTYTYDFGVQFLEKKKDWTSKKINFVQQGLVPKYSIGYKVVLSGCTSAVSSKRYFKNDYYNSWVATKTGYTYNLAATERAAGLEQEWSFKYVSSATADKTIKPQVTIHYVYPQLSANE